MLETLKPEQLYHSCNPDDFSFTDTSELEILDVPLGQQRAMEAIEFGVEINHDGFNLFVLGAPGLGKHRLVQQILAKRAQPRTPLFDWCYVNNFDNPQKPRLLKLPLGMGQRLCADMKQLVEDLLTAIPAAFQSEDYRRRREEIAEQSHQRYEQSFKALEEEARAHGVAVMRTPSGYTMAPMVDDKVITSEEFDKLEKEKQQDIEKTIEHVQQRLQEIIREMPLIRREVSRRLKALNQEITQLTVEQFVAGIEQAYTGHEEILGYLSAVKTNAIENAQDFIPPGDGMEVDHPERRAEAFHIYQVNVLVDNTDRDSAPIIVEDNPTFQNLVGRIEHVAQMGTLVTDFTLIKPGALHKANGGYLILDVRKVLTQIYAWEGLKRSLQSGQVTITSLEQALSLASTLSLEPEAMPIDVKVILTGEAPLYYLLKHYDHEFDKLFKVAADFSYRTELNAQNKQLYARVIATQQQGDALKPINRAGVARIIEAASRYADDSTKISLNVEYVNDVLKEADYWATKANSQVIALEHIQQALEKQRYRHDRIREQYHEHIIRGISLIETSGSAVGQINGLSVLAVGGHAFGSPSRITATARLGQGKVVDIEREVKLGGEIHSKGVMILSAYMANRYAQNSPLPLSASLVFEQTYNGVDGDSATAAELCVLLSAIANIPVKQNLAVTGSMNQHGQIQAIGGVNEKIEGFFDICSAHGLSGDQGVIIPASNQVHLMLREDVREAVNQGKFAIYTAQHVDDVMSALSGMTMGDADTEGNYPADTVNGKITARITELQSLHKQFAAAGKSASNGQNQADGAGEETGGSGNE